MVPAGEVDEEAPGTERNQPSAGPGLLGRGWLRYGGEGLPLVLQAPVAGTDMPPGEKGFSG